MPHNHFLDKSNQPTSALLAKALGPRNKFLEELKTHIRDTHGPIVEEWKFYGKTIGWTLKMLLGKRNLFFLTASDGHFTISFTLGDKAVAAVVVSKLPAELVQRLVTARKYVEGRGVRTEVRTARDVEHVMELVDIKVDH